MQRFITIICVAFMFVGIAGGSMADSISDALVVEGRALLFNNGDPTYQGIIDANAKFEQANTADDEDQKAMLFLAVTKLAVFGLENGDNPAMLQTFRDLYEAFGVSRTDAESLLDSPISEPPTVFDEYDPPETMPNGDELQTFLAGPFFDLIIEVIGYVDGVTDQAIMINVTAEELGDVTGVEVDYGDVLLLRSSLYTLKAFILFMDSYDMDALDIQEFSVLINADVIQLQRDIFARYGDFLKLKPTNSLAASKTALLTAIDTWQAAYDFIVAEGEPQEDDLFAFGSEEEIDDAEDTLAQMADFRTSLADNVPMEIETREIKWVLTNIDNGTKLGFWVEIEDGEVGEGHAWGIDNCEFLFCSGGVDEYSINGDQITIQLETYQWCEDHEEILSATLTGTLNETHDQIISGTYSKPGCSGQSTGPFDFTGELIEDETEVVKMDFNLIFGNTGKLAIDIHDALPEFDVYDEPTPGSFPEPVLGGFFPDISTNGDATMFFELQPSGPFVIPTRTVTFTGNMADWLSNELLHDDIEGDNDTEIIGADIENVYLAKDATYLYVGMTLYDGVPNQAVVYGVGFRNWADDGYMPLKIYAAYNPGFLTWFAGLNQWDSDVFTDPTGVFVGTNCIEWKIPLIEITTRLDNNSLSGKFVSTATLLVENGEELDVNETRIQLDPATLTGDFTCPAYDGTGKIFIKVMGEADPNSDWDLGSIWVDGSSGTYTIGGLPAGQDVYVYAFWDKDDNGVVTYPDLWWGTADDSPFTIQAGTNTLNIDITNPFDPFVVDGRIIYVHESDDSFKTYYIVDVSNFKLGDLPDGVTAVTVKDPAGNVLLTMGDLEFYGEWNEFFIAVDGEPQLGTYEFSVTAGGITITVTDTQDANTVVPVPDTGSLVPADGAVVDSMTPVFSWDAVDFKNAFYRLQIIDQLGNWVYATSRVPGMLWAVVPQNILQPGQTYSWRIRVIDSDNWLDVQNRANSDWISFTMAGTSNNGAPPPVNFVMDGAIIHYYTADGSSKTWYDLYIHDYPETVSLPDDVESLIITGPDGVVVDGKDQIPYEGGGDFFTEVNGPPQIGTYTFSVTIGGTTKTYADVQVVNRFIPTPEATQFSVESDAVINVKTPTFTWDPVSVDGVQLYYRLQIRDADGQYVHTTPRTLGMTSYTLPEGVLNPDTQYQYRVRVSDADDWLYVQNRAHSGWQDFSTAASLGDVATAFKMEANVLNYTASGGSQKTWYDLYLYEYSGTAALPDAVTALTITGPGGGVVVSTKGEMEYTVYGAAEGDFFTEVSGRPLTGTYTFSVTIGGITKTYADVQIVNHAIPTPDATQFSVQSDAVIDVKTPTFTWNPVSLAGVPLYYRLQIQDAGGQDVHTTPRTLGMTSYTLPEGVLTPGSSYQYRVRVSDADNWLYVQNRAHSGWQGFSTDISLGDSASAFQIEGNVLNYTAADGSQKTWYDLYLYDYSGTAALPDAVTALTITGPGGGVVVNTKGEMEYTAYGAAEGDFFKEVSGTPQVGNYTFSVTIGGTTKTYADVQIVNHAIPTPDATQFSVQSDAVINVNTPTFTWDPVSVDGVQLYYRLQIREAGGQDVYTTPRTLGMTSYTLPVGVLSPDIQYQYRIRISDAGDWSRVGNRAHSDWISFAMADILLSHDATPALDLDGWGVVAYSGGDYSVAWTNLDTSVKVIDHDGIASDGSSHRVTLEFPDHNTYELNYDYSESPTVAYYYRYFEGTPDSGDYIFRVVDPGGNSGQITDQLTVNPLAPPRAIAPAMDYLVADTCPTFQWNAVAGANRYRIRIYNMDDSTVMRGNTPNTTEWTVPPGILAPNTQYKYRVEARDAHSNFEVDSSTRYPDSSDDYIRFTTGSEIEAPYIDFDSTGVNTWNHPDVGHKLSFWIKVHDAGGVPGNIKLVKVRFPDYATSGKEALLYFDYNESSTCGVYQGESFLPIQPGPYTFVVEDNDEHVMKKVDPLDVNYLTQPDNWSFDIQPQPDGDGTGFNFTWDPVESGFSGFYRLEIYDRYYNRLDTFATEQTEYDLAPGFLAKHELYRFRITARREFFDENVDNGASMPCLSDDRPTLVAVPLTGGGNTPSIDLASWGAVIYHYPHPIDGTDKYRLAFNVKVSDADGVPKNIQSVTATHGTTTWDLYYESDISDNEAYYWRWFEIYDPGTVGGTYTFEVKDTDGNSAQVVDVLTVNVLSIPGGLKPADGTSFYGTCPVIEWDPVEGASIYRARIYNGLYDTLHKGGYVEDLSYTVPPGVLDLNQIFSYRIRACRENFLDEGVDLDNLSVSEMFATSIQPHITTRELDLGGSILTLQIVAGMQPEGISAGADVNGDGNIGLAEAIYGLQKEAGLR